MSRRLFWQVNNFFYLCKTTAVHCPASCRKINMSLHDCWWVRWMPGKREGSESPLVLAVGFSERRPTNPSKTLMTFQKNCRIFLPHFSHGKIGRFKYLQLEGIVFCLSFNENYVPPQNLDQVLCFSPWWMAQQIRIESVWEGPRPADNTFVILIGKACTAALIQ